MRPSLWLSTSCLTATAACLVLLAAAVPSAVAAPATDGQGYADSTARCAAPDKAVAFGSTATSRVAICQASDGQYTYRGVRVRDGARLVVPATSSDGGFVAVNDGITYTVTASALVVSSGNKVIRDESMVDYHAPGGSAAPSAAPPAATTPAVAPPPTATTPTPPPGPPLPAEKGYTG